jgi:hypothetical protein
MWSEKNKAQKLELYFSSLEAATSDNGGVNSSIELLGGGHFRKCGKFFESWKRRSYFIYSNSVLIYFENNLPKNIINIDNVSVEDGDENMIQKSGVRRGLARQESGGSEMGLSDIPEESVMVGEGSESEVAGIAIILTLQNDCRERVKIVFESLTEAQKFCLLLKFGSQSNNVLEFVQRKRWFNVATAFDGRSPPSLYSSHSLSSPSFPSEIDTNSQEVKRGYFPIMNSVTKSDLHNELSLLQSANQIVLVKLSLLNGVMRKSGITWQNPMDLLNETFDVARSHLVRQHYVKKQRYLEERIDDCNRRLQLLPSHPEVGTEVSREDESDVNVEELIAHAQRVLQKQEALHGSSTPSSHQTPQPPPPPPRPSLTPQHSAPVLSTKESTSSLSSVPSPRSPRMPTPVVSPAQPRPSSTREEKIRALWPAEDEEDPIMNPSHDSVPVPVPISRPVSLPHKAPSQSPKNPPPERRTSLVAKQHKLSLWRKEIHERLETAYLVMKKIVPRDIPRLLSPNDDFEQQTQQFCYHFGFELALGKRILQKKCLWLITFSDSELSQVSREDLEDGGAYALKGQALDVIELSAIYYRLDPLPKEGEEHDSKGRHPGEDWEDMVHKIRKKLKYYLTQEANGTLSEHLRRHPAYEVKREKKREEEIKEKAPSVPSPQRRRGSLRYEDI